MLLLERLLLQILYCRSLSWDQLTSQVPTELSQIHKTRLLFYLKYYVDKVAEIFELGSHNYFVETCISEPQGKVRGQFFTSSNCGEASLQQCMLMDGDCVTSTIKA